VRRRALPPSGIRASSCSCCTYGIACAGGLLPRVGWLVYADVRPRLRAHKRHPARADILRRSLGGGCGRGARGGRRRGSHVGRRHPSTRARRWGFPPALALPPPLASCSSNGRDLLQLLGTPLGLGLALEGAAEAQQQALLALLGLKPPLPLPLH